MKNPSVLAFGELLWDLLPSGRKLGGAPANFAFRLNSLGILALPVSCIGRDQLGDEALSLLKEAEVDCSLVQRHSNLPTGTVDVWLNDAGDASYRINGPVAYDETAFSSELASAIKSCSVLYYGSLVQRSPVTRSTLEKAWGLAGHAIRFCDLNLRKDCYTTETVKASLKAATILKLNDEESVQVAAMLGWNETTPKEFAARAIQEFKLSACLVTRGARGAFCLDSSGCAVDVAGKSVQVVDTIGSGDSFSAGYLFKKLSGASFQECCEFGNHLGALVATKAGAMCRLSEYS